MPGSYTALATSGRVVPDSASVAHAASNALLTATANVVVPACDVSLSARCQASGDCVSGEFTQSIIPVACNTRYATVAINNSVAPGAEKEAASPVATVQTSGGTAEMLNNIGTHTGIMLNPSDSPGNDIKSSDKLTVVTTGFTPSDAGINARADWAGICIRGPGHGSRKCPVLIPVRSHRIIMKREEYS